MKNKNLLIAAMLCGIIGLASCGGSAPADNKEKGKEAEGDKTEATEENSDETETSGSVSGEEIFTSKGCVACHQADAKTVGPSLKDIAAAYSGNPDGLTAFLKGEGEAIVDPAQAAVMQPQIAVTKDMSAAELEAVVNHIMSK
jgi:cytochrome c